MSPGVLCPGLCVCVGLCVPRVCPLRVPRGPLDAPLGGAGERGSVSGVCVPGRGSIPAGRVPFPVVITDLHLDTETGPVRVGVAQCDRRADLDRDDGTEAWRLVLDDGRALIVRTWSEVPGVIVDHGIPVRPSP